MVLGVGLHFLPRLASAPPVSPRLARSGFWILLAGLTLRIAGPPLAAIVERHALQRASDIAWTVGAAGELVGLLLVLAALGRSIAAGRSLRTSSAVRSTMPFFIVSFGSLLLATGLTLLLALPRLPDDLPLDRTTSDSLTLLILYGFLVSISVAMSTRLFPLYLRTRSPRLRLLQTGLTLLVAGTAARLAGNRWDIRLLDWGGRTVLLVAVVNLVLGTGIFERRRPLPRRAIYIWEDAPGLHALSAYIWLVAAAVVQAPGIRWESVELHLLGMGFITMLIFGMGVHLLPGFVRGAIRHRRYVWATLVLGNLATICRVVPAIPNLHLNGRDEQFVGAAAGVAGLLAVALFTVNLSSALAGRPSTNMTDAG